MHCGDAVKGASIAVSFSQTSFIKKNIMKMNFLNLVLQKPSIDSSSNAGLEPDTLTGNIEFKNVVFQYPSRPDVPVR